MPWALPWCPSLKLRMGPFRTLLGDSQVPLFGKEMWRTRNLALSPSLPCLLLFINLRTQLRKYHFHLLGSHAPRSQSWGKCSAVSSSQPSPFPLLPSSGTELSSFLPSAGQERKQFRPPQPAQAETWWAAGFLPALCPRHSGPSSTNKWPFSATHSHCSCQAAHRILPTPQRGTDEDGRGLF